MGKICSFRTTYAAGAARAHGEKCRDLRLRFAQLSRLKRVAYFNLNDIKIARNWTLKGALQQYFTLNTKIYHQNPNHDAVRAKIRGSLTQPRQ